MRDDLRAVCQTPMRTTRPCCATAPRTDARSCAPPGCQTPARRDSRRVSPAGRPTPGRGALLGDSRRHCRHFVRGHARELHQRRGDDELCSTGRRLLGIALRRPGRLLPGVASHHLRAGDRCRRAADGRRRPLGGHVRSRPRDRRSRAGRHRGRVRARRGRGRRPGRTGLLRRGQGSAPRPLGPHRSQDRRDPARPRRSRTPRGSSPTRRRLRRVLSDAAVLALVDLAERAEQHYGEPQDMEWAISGDDVFLVQSRPITTLDIVGEQRASGQRSVPRRRASSPGACASCSDVDEARAVQAGEILVAPMTTPDWVPAMRRAGALVTDSGGVTCHAAIVEPRAARPVHRRDAQRDLRAARRRARDGRRRRRARSTRATASRADARLARHRAGGARHRASPAHRRAARHPAVRQPRDRRARGGGRRAPGRRRGPLRAEFMVTDALGASIPAASSPRVGRPSSWTGWPLP